MLRVTQTTPRATEQAQAASADLVSGNFGNKSVTVAASAEHFIDHQPPDADKIMPEPRPIATIRVQQPRGEEEQQHFLTFTSLATEGAGNTTLPNEQAIAKKADELASFATSATELKNYTLKNHSEGLISDRHSEMFTTLADYNKVLDKHMVRIANLADKVNKNKASPKQINELNSLLRSHKHNLSMVQAHLSHLDSHHLTPEEQALSKAFEMRFAERHIDLADVMTMFSDSLPDQEPISRGERIEYSLLQAKGCLKAVQKMDVPGLGHGKKTNIEKAIKEHCMKLENAAKFERGEHNPKTDDLSLELLTEDFTLVKDKKKLSSSLTGPLNKQWDEFAFGQGKPLPLTHPKISQTKMLELFVEHQLNAAGVEKNNKPNVHFLLRQGIIDEINKQEWPIVDKKVQFKVNEKEHTAQSTITPAAHLAKHFETNYPSNGISSMDRMQYKHVPNMAHSKMTATDGELTFSGIRHGALDPYTINTKNLGNLPENELATMIKELLLDNGVVEIPDGQEPTQYASTVARQVKAGEAEIPDLAGKLRDESSKMMAKELLTAAVVSDPQKLQDALDGETVDVALNSISLVTPDQLRGTMKAGSSGDEKAMLARQAASLKNLAASGKPIQLNVRDNHGEVHPITVMPKVRTFNFGVNRGAVATSLGVLGPSTPLWGRAMGWEFAANMNNPELRDLLGPPGSRELGGAVAAKLTQMSESTDEATQKRATLLKQAATQAKSIWKSESFRSGGREPYKMVSRLALISHLMGETTLYNCKSGKDRTGQLDAEVKYLASVGNATGQIPKPETAHTGESRRMRTNFALNTGNHEMQQMTVGLKGYKLKGVPGLKKMMEADMMDNYYGGSKFVKT